MTLHEAHSIKDRLLYHKVERKVYFNAFVRPFLFYLPYIFFAVITKFRHPFFVVAFIIATVFTLFTYLIIGVQWSERFKSDVFHRLLEKYRQKEEAKRLKKLEKVADTVIFQHESKAKIEVLKQEIERLKSIGGADV